MSCQTLGAVLPSPLWHIVLGTNGVPFIESTHITLESAMVEYLTSHEFVGCLVGNRFFPHQVSRENPTWPAVTYERNGTDHAHGLAGSAGFATANIGLDIWSPLFSETVETAEAIRLAMQGFQGWWGGIAIHAVILDGESGGVERPADASGTWWYSRSLDFSIRYIEPVPEF